MGLQTLGAVVTDDFLVSRSLATKSLAELRDRLILSRSDRPIEVELEVELEHRGATLPCQENGKEEGRVVVLSGPQGVEVRESERSGGPARFAIWRSWQPLDPGKAGIPLVDCSEARHLVEPVDAIAALLGESVLVETREVVWDGQLTQRLALRPSRRSARMAEDGTPRPVTVEARLWLGMDGWPLALERRQELRIPGLTTSRSQALIYRQAGGRLLVGRSVETWSGTGLAARQGTDIKRMTVAAG